MGSFFKKEEVVVVREILDIRGFNSARPLALPHSNFEGFNGGLHSMTNSNQSFGLQTQEPRVQSKLITDNLAFGTRRASKIALGMKGLPLVSM